MQIHELLLCSVEYILSGVMIRVSTQVQQINQQMKLTWPLIKMVNEIWQQHKMPK